MDGNGRATRLLADLVYLAGQTGLEPIHAFNWEIDRTTNIGLLGEYVMTRKPNALAKIIPVINLEEAEKATKIGRLLDHVTRAAQSCNRAQQKPSPVSDRDRTTATRVMRDP